MPNSRRRLNGQVVSNKMDKTVVVRVDRTYRHPLYGKVLREFKKYYAHDEYNEAEIGDEVLIVESRPLSKLKRWVVQEIVREDLSARAASVEEVAEVPELIADEEYDDEEYAEDFEDDGYEEYDEEEQ